MVELRKRKEAATPAAQPPVPKKANSVKSSSSAKANGSTAVSSKVAVGDSINFDDFGGEIETSDGEKTSLKQLVEDSRTGVVLFTYPKASTPGCTTQACLFRDGFTQLTATGLSIYGLSTDSPKSNSTFKTKQNLPYTLLCDPAATLIGAIGLKKAPKGTMRGVFVVDKGGKVLAAETGGPAATVEVVKKLTGDEPAPAGGASTDTGDKPESSKIEQEIEEGKTSAQEAGTAPTAGEEEPAKQSTTEGGDAANDKAQAEVAAQVADSAENLDRTPVPA